MNTMGHGEIRERFSAYVDRELPARERAELLAHLEGCPDCHTGLARFERAVAQVRGLERHRAPVDFSRQVLRRVRARRRGGWAALITGPLYVPAEAALPVLIAAVVAVLLMYAAP